jgi:flap endonuclease-1
MGIHGLMKLLSEECPEAIKEQELENFMGRRIAIDASMAMYQFLIAVRSNGPGNQAAAMLMNEAGEITSHIQGMFNRTIKLMTSGIRPVYVFDGKPPQLKGGELAKRMARRARAEADLAKAEAAEDIDDVDRFSKRLVKVTRQHNEDCQELLRLMGIPCIIAPCEAEAQCAELARKSKVYATATEDMDALTFRTPKLVRRLTLSQSTKDKNPILEIDFEVMLRGLDLTYEQFVDMCILCGCDYCSTIKGIGPKTALRLIKQYKSLERIIEVLKNEKKYAVPVDWVPMRVSKHEPTATDEDQEEVVDDAIQEVEEAIEEVVEDILGESSLKDAAVEANGNGNAATADGSTAVIDAVAAEPLVEDENFEVVEPLFAQARKLFVNCDVLPAESVELKWNEPDEAGLTSFLVDRMGFNAERVASGIKKLKEAQQQKAQKRMDSFFTSMGTMQSSTGKRKAEEVKGKGGKPDAKKPFFGKKK